METITQRIKLKEKKQTHVFEFTHPFKLWIFINGPKLISNSKLQPVINSKLTRLHILSMPIQLNNWFNNNNNKKPQETKTLSYLGNGTSSVRQCCGGGLRNTNSSSVGPSLCSPHQNQGSHSMVDRRKGRRKTDWWNRSSLPITIDKCCSILNLLYFLLYPHFWVQSNLRNILLKGYWKSIEN
jgi:hypothetical protein